VGSGTPDNIYFVARAASAGTLTAKLTAKSPETVSAGYTASASKKIDAASADLQVSLTPPTGKVYPGQQVQYGFAVANLGPSTATKVSITGTLTKAGEIVPPQGCTASGSKFTCSVATLPGGSPITAAFLVRPSDAGTMDATLQAKGAEADPDSANSTAKTSTTVTPLPPGDVSILAKAGKKSVKLGKGLALTATVRNKSRNAAQNVFVRATLKDGLGFGSGSPGCTYAESIRTVTCMLGNLAGNQKKTARIDVVGNARGNYSQLLVAGGLMADANTRNNVAALAFKIK
jgi:uncharacterized repeat protein (TIGR01451 family)